jgi:hypothetical protein
VFERGYASYLTLLLSFEGQGDTGDGVVKKSQIGGLTNKYFMV